GAGRHLVTSSGRATAAVPSSHVRPSIAPDDAVVGLEAAAVPAASSETAPTVAAAPAEVPADVGHAGSAPGKDDRHPAAATPANGQSQPGVTAVPPDVQLPDGTFAS